jgi:hypothetical protein
MSITVSLIDSPPDVILDAFNAATNEDWSREYQLKKDDEPLAIDLSWKFYMQMQDSNGNVAANINSDNQKIVVTDRAAGKFALQIKMSETSQVAPGLYDYDIVLVAGDGIYRLVSGSITVQRGITIVPGQEKWTHYPLISRP